MTDINFAEFLQAVSIGLMLYLVKSLIELQRKVDILATKIEYLEKHKHRHGAHPSQHKRAD